MGKFLETEDLGITHSLGMKSERLDCCVREVKRRNILGVFGCPVFGFDEDNFDFMRELPFVIQVWFWEIHLRDIDGLYALKNLEYFGVAEKRPPIDFSRFPRLKTMVWHPIKNDAGLETLGSLNRLDVWRYKSRVKSWSGFRLHPNLARLELNWCNPDSLDGMPVMPNLVELQIHYCRNLRSIEAITGVAPNLRHLVVTRCANLEHFDAIEQFDWEHLYINIRGKTVAEVRN